MFTLAELQAAGPIQFKPVKCPHCEADLRGQFPILIATRNCPGCGKRVVAEPEGDDSTPLFTREQLEATCAAYTRVHSRVSWVFLAGFLGLLVGIIVSALYRDTIRDAVQPVMDPGWFMILVMFCPCIASFAVAVVLLSRATRTALKCPHCNAPCSVVANRVAPNLTQLTGNCAKCGRKLVNEPPTEEPAGPLPTVDEFKAAERRAMRDNWSGLFLIAVILATPMGFLLIGDPEQLWLKLEQRYGLMTAAVVGSGLFIGYVLGMFGVAVVGLRWLSRRHERKRAAEPLLTCPHCREGLRAARQIIAGKRCPACRKRVLAEPEPQPAITEG